MPIITTRTEIIDGDQSWLGSAHGQWNARTVPLDLSKFSADAYSKTGVLPQGYPLAIGSDGVAGPYTSENFAGHLMHDIPMTQATATGKILAPMLDHGRVVTAKVPVTGFTKPATQPNSTITYI